MAPQQSNKSFIPPVGVPIKKTPPIIDIIQDKIERPTAVVKPEVLVEIVSESEVVEDTKVEPIIEPIIEVESEPVLEVDTPAETEPVQQDLIIPKERGLTLANPLKTDETDSFAFHWKNLFETIFKNIPTIYYPLKEYTPQIKGNLIYIDLKNEIQKEHFEPKIREVLSYLRMHYSDLIENVVINVDETIVTRKIVYDTGDKMQNLKEQNLNFEEFSSILGLKVKE